ncbi:MAG: pilus assembly protein [Bryobacterales bacterium]|nr:pilus assembly protein [Bryobacterales bacterium]
MAPSRKTDGSRRGQALVELPLVLIPLVALWVAVVDFSFAIFLKGTFQHAAREGARYAVTSRTEPGLGHDASIQAAVQRHAMGFLNGPRGAAKIHIRYYVPGTFTETQSNAGGNIVEVSIEDYTWNWIAPVLRGAAAPLNVVARSSDRMEASPGGLPPAR